MDQQQNIFKEICLKSIFCQDNKCQLNHSRVYVGVCIEYLRQEEQFYNDGGEEFNQKDCNSKNCNLWHFNQEKLNDLVSQRTINGIFCHNLCPKGCKSEDCNFLYREWAEGVCLNNIIKLCRNKQCKYRHEAWDSLQEKAKACSLIRFITPEEVCNKEKCNCGKHPAFLKEYCIPYLRGLCKNKKCLKNHIDWEKINNQINQQNSLKSCIIIAQEIKKKNQSMPDFKEVELICEKSEFTHYKKWFNEQNIIDIVFIMDLTGSMKPWKELMQKTIAKIIDQFLNSINGYQVRVAFIGYRDVCDKENNLVFWSFTKKIDEIQNFISKLEAKGGGDEAEDVVSAFGQALKLNFSHHPDSLLCTFLLADAPCHGRDYHNIKSDDLIDEMPKNYFEDVLEKYKQIKKNNFLCCVKINEKTDIMFNKMKAVIPMMTITTEKKPEDLLDVVGFTLRMSVTESKRLKSLINNQIQYFKADFVKFKLDTFTTDYEDDDYWKQYHEMVDSTKRIGVTGLKVTMDKNELNKENDNSSTYIFKAFDAINNREIVIKIPKTFVDNQGKITQEEISIAEEYAKVRFYSSCYACQMAYFFNQRLKETELLNEMQPLFYAHPILYTLETPFYGMKLIYGETYLQIQYKFQKYTTNSNYIDPNKYFYSAFSHFSFQVSKENLVIMDLQGCNNILTDASIQTDQDWESILKKDLTNRKNKGIEDFKSKQHSECSYLCKKLKLDSIYQSTKTNQNACPQDLIQNAYGICYDCDEFVSFEVKLINNLKGKKFHFNCNFCLSESQNFIDQECNCCHYLYQTPINQQIKQLTNLGNCWDCKNKCQKKLNKCYYCKRDCQKSLIELTINNTPFYVCENAQDYLSAFICKKCSQPYQRNSIISIENYNEKSFTCC